MLLQQPNAARAITVHAMWRCALKGGRNKGRREIPLPALLPIPLSPPLSTHKQHTSGWNPLLIQWSFFFIAS
jgi:hypothetical protein